MFWRRAPPHPNLPIFFNVDSAVGAAPAANMPEDVLLVLFLMRLIGDNPGASGMANGGVTEMLKQVNPTGIMDDRTIIAIRGLQTLVGTTADGRVSPALHYKYGANFYTIVDLNFSIRDRSKFHATWPNLDKIAGCPPMLQLAVRRALAGQSAPRD